jgi:hypothetical protein
MAEEVTDEGWTASGTISGSVFASKDLMSFAKGKFVSNDADKASI